MSTQLHRPFLLATISLLCAGLAAQQGETKGAETPPAAAKAATVTYSVVRRGETLSIVSSDELAKLRAELAAAHESAVKSWEAAKVAAETTKKPFTQAKPTAEKVVALAADLKTRPEAETRLHAIKQRAAPARREADRPKPLTKPRAEAPKRKKG